MLIYVNYHRLYRLKHEFKINKAEIMATIELNGYSYVDDNARLKLSGVTVDSSGVSDMAHLYSDVYIILRDIENQNRTFTLVLDGIVCTLIPKSAPVRCEEGKDYIICKLIGFKAISPDMTAIKGASEDSTNNKKQHQLTFEYTGACTFDDAVSLSRFLIEQGYSVEMQQLGSLTSNKDDYKISATKNT